MRSKTSLIRSYTSQLDFDIFVFTETWLTSDFFDEEFFDSNFYNVYRKDRDVLSTGCTRGGGVLIAVKKCIISNVVPLDNNNHLFDQLCVSVKSRKGRLYFCVSYIPPNSSEELYLGHIQNIMHFAENMNYDDRCCVLGDYNLNNVIWHKLNDSPHFMPSNVNKNFEINFIDSLFSLDLYQVNPILNKLGKILDLVFISTDLKVSVVECVFAISSPNTHHSALDITIQFYEYLNDFGRTDAQYNYNFANFNLINALVLDINWASVLSSKIVSICYVEFLKEVNTIFKNNICASKPKIHKFPWYTRGLKKLKNLRNKYYERFKADNNTNDENLYLHYMREFNFLNKFLYNQYLMGYGDSIKENPKRFWTFIRSRQQNSSIPSSMVFNNFISNSLIDSANLFKEYFQSNFSCDDIFGDDLTFSNILSHIDISDLQISEDDIRTGISKLSLSYRADVDGISSFLLKQCCTSLMNPLRIIFSKSLLSGYFIQKWKITTVIPIYKSGHKNEVVNYRPISKLSNISKLFEHIVYDKLFFPLKRYINPAQHGFVIGRSTTSNLAVFTRYCIDNFAQGFQVDAIYADFSKAFDRVPHNLLIFKLEKIGIRGCVLRWFRNYLLNRHCRVCVDGVYSDPYFPTSGVPQGSILGPILFNIFVNDIAHCFHNARHLLYADDLKIFKAIRSMNDAILLQHDIDRFVEWSVKNGLPINLSKCMQLTYHRCHNIILSRYNMLNHGLEKVYEIVDLGVVFDVKLTFVAHLNYIIPKAYSTLYFIRRNTTQFSDPYIRKIVFTSFVRSKLEYASFIWSPSAEIHKNRIERIQKSFIKFALNSFHFSEPIPSYFSKCLLISLKTLSSRRDICSLTFLQGIISGVIDCSELLTFVQINAPSRTLRYYYPFHLDTHSTNYVRNEPLRKSMRLFNSICASIDFTLPRDKFNNLLQNIIL